MNSNKKLLSVLLAAVLLVGCIVGMLIVGANAAGPKVFTVGTNGEYQNFDSALAAVAEATWQSGDSAEIQIEAGSYASAAESPLLFGQTTIWADKAAGVKLPIKIVGAGSGATTIQVASQATCANDYTFDALTIEGTSTLTLSAGSGEVVFLEDAAISANVYPAGANTAAFEGWATPEEGKYIETSLTVGSKVTALGVSYLQTTTITADEFAAVDGVEDSGIVPSMVNFTLYVNGDYSAKGIRFAHKSRPEVFYNKITVDVGENGKVGDLRGSDGALTVKNAALKFHDGAQVTGNGNSVWFFDMAMTVTEDFTIECSGADTLVDFNVCRNRGAHSVKGDMYVKLADGYKMNKHNLPPVLCFAPVEGTCYITIDGAVSSADVMLFGEYLRSGDGSFPTNQIATATKCGGMVLDIDNANFGGSLKFYDSSAIGSYAVIDYANAIGADGLTMTMDSTTIAGGLTVLDNKAVCHGDASIAINDSSVGGSFGVASTNTQIKGDLTLDLNTVTVGTVTVAYNATISGNVDVDLTDVTCTDRKTSAGAYSTVAGFRLAGGSTIGTSKENKHTVDFAGTTNIAGPCLLYGSSVMNGDLAFTVGGQSVIGISSDEIAENAAGYDILYQGTLNGNMTFVAKDNAKFVSSFNVVRTCPIDGDISFTMQDNVTMVGNRIHSGSRNATSEVNNITVTLKDNVSIQADFWNAGYSNVTGNVKTTVEGNVHITGTLYGGGRYKVAGLIENEIRAAMVGEEIKAPQIDTYTILGGYQLGTNSASVRNTISAGTFGKAVYGGDYKATTEPCTYVKIENYISGGIFKDTGAAFIGGSNSAGSPVAEIYNEITGGTFGQHVHLGGWAQTDKITSVLGTEGKGAEGPNMGRNLYTAGNGVQGTVVTTIYSGTYGYLNELYPEAGAGHILCGARTGNVESTTTYVYGGHIHGLRGAGYGAHATDGGSYADAAETYIYGGYGFETGIRAGFAGDQAYEEGVTPPVFVLVIDPREEMDIRGAVGVFNDRDQITLKAGKYIVSGIPAEESNYVGSSYQNVTVEEGVEFIVTEWVQDKLYFALTEANRANATITTAEGVTEAYYTVTEEGVIYIYGGYEPQEIFYGLQLDMSGNQIKFYAYLNKDAVETLAARYGDEFIVEYTLGQKGGAFALANLELDGEYYVADLGYLSASEFVAAYSFTSKDAVAKTGILLDFIGGHALNEENEAEMQALCAALYTYGYQAAAEFGTLDEYANEAYAALQTRADAADLLAAYEIYAGEQYHNATSTEGFKMAGMTTLLGNQIAINVYVETEVTGDVVIDIAGQKYNATLADAEISGVAYKYFTIAPNVEHMAAIISMTISQGEAQLGTATVSIPGYAAAMVTEDAENAELYYAILGYIAAVEELPPEWLA